MDNILLQPIVQYGFLGFSAVLLAIIIWLIRRLLDVLDANNRIIAANTAAVHDLTVMTRDLMHLNRAVHDKLLARPCLARGEG